MTAQQLKNSILQMAVQGKLVPQDSDDEAASVLLERIRSEKERMVKEGKIKKEKNPSTIFRGTDNKFYEKIGNGEPVCIEDEIPFDIPDSWEWVRFKEIILIVSGTSYDKKDVKKSGIRIIRGGNIIGNKLMFYDDDVFVPMQYYDEEKTIKKDDVIFVASTGSKTVIGKPARVLYDDEAAQIGAFVRIARPVYSHISDLVWLIFQSDYYRKHIRTLSVGTNINNVKVGYVERLLVPVPPLSEQKRIVAKLTEVLPYLDRYDEQSDVLSSLDGNFPNKLRNSILQTAVQGKLVPQDPDDEPASVLLERIRSEKEQMVKEGKIKRDKNPSTIFRGTDNRFYEKIGNSEPICIDDEIPFDIPDSWEWARLGSISDYNGRKDKIQAQKADRTLWELDLEDIEKGGRVLTKKTVGERQAIGDKTAFHVGDILYSKLRPYLLKILVAPEDGICTSEIVPFSVYGDMSAEYMVYVLKSPTVDSYINNITYGVKMPRVGTETMVNLLIPVPPLAEQKRIIAKINEIFSLLDENDSEKALMRR